jgi:muramoyltetrapeptide carboxypeptidase
LGESINAEENQFAGSDELRARDLQKAIDDKEIKAVFFARGGYGSVRMIDKVDFTPLEKNPKWLIGYSDVTVILNHVYFKHSVATLHAIMPVNIKKEIYFSSAIESLLSLLFGQTFSFTSTSDFTQKDCKVKGRVIGGNLSVLYSMLGSESFGQTDDLILLIEDLDEYLYHIDRMMQALKRAGKLKNLKALIVGAMTQMHDNTIPFGKTAYEIIEEAVKEYNYPKIFGVSIGHIEEKNNAVVIGGEMVIEVKNNQIKTLQ